MKSRLTQLTKLLIYGDAAVPTLANPIQAAKPIFLYAVGYCSTVEIFAAPKDKLIANLPIIAKCITSHVVPVTRDYH